MEIHTPYKANENRYKKMKYRRCGNSGLLLPEISFGLWHNFGENSDYNNARELILTGFDNGITHFDLANNYGPPPGAAETTFGKILANDLKSYRDELIISTKAGYTMWPGPYGDWGSRKYLVASCDQSLKRMGIDYVDIFYIHRFDPNTPLEETMQTLDYIVRSGRALYIGISRFSAEDTQQALKILKELGTPCLIHQEKYSMFHREPENGILNLYKERQLGSIMFSPLAQGLLSEKYIKEIPLDSRAAELSSPFLTNNDITDTVRKKIIALNNIAIKRGQKLPQLALAWLLRRPEITSVLVGARNTTQLLENIAAINNTIFSNKELFEIDSILAQ